MAAHSYLVFPECSSAHLHRPWGGFCLFLTTGSGPAPLSRLLYLWFLITAASSTACGVHSAPEPLVAPCLLGVWELEPPCLVFIWADVSPSTHFLKLLCLLTRLSVHFSNVHFSSLSCSLKSRTPPQKTPKYYMKYFKKQELLCPCSHQISSDFWQFQPTIQEPVRAI